MLLGNNYSTLIHSFDRGLIIYIYSPIPHFRNLLFDHSFLTEGIDLLSFFIALSIHAFGRGRMLHVKLFFCHPALLISKKKYSTLIHSFGKGLILVQIFAYISIFLSRTSSIILHACPIPYFKKSLFDQSPPSEDIQSSMSFQKIPLPSIIALSFHTLTGPAWSISL